MTKMTTVKNRAANRSLTIIFLGGLGSLAMFTFGHGCSPFHSDQTESSLGANTPPGDTSPYPIIAGARTVSLAYGKLYLDSLVLCSGIGQPSLQTQQLWEQKKGAISESGSPETLTAPMLMAMASIAGEVCSDLINQELALASAVRRIFQEVNFTAGPSQFSSGSLIPPIRRMARSCWNRDPDSDEESLILSTVNSVSTGVSESGEQTINILKVVCTSMLASLETIEN